VKSETKYHYSLFTLSSADGGQMVGTTVPCSLLPLPSWVGILLINQEQSTKNNQQTTINQEQSTNNNQQTTNNIC
jgi:hypothetical protein